MASPSWKRSIPAATSIPTATRTRSTPTFSPSLGRIRCAAANRSTGEAGSCGARRFRTFPLYDRKLTVADVQERIESYWRPYQGALKAALDAVHARFGCVYHLNCHSNRSVAPPGLADDAGTVRPEMELGTLDGATCEPEFTAFVHDTLVAMGYGVVVDGFNKGEHLIRHYADPAAGRHSMMLEVRKDLYMDEKTIGKNDRFAGTRADMSRLAAAISAYAKEKA